MRLGRFSVHLGVIWKFREEFRILISFADLFRNFRVEQQGMLLVFFMMAIRARGFVSPGPRRCSSLMRRSAFFQEKIEDKLILAPLTRGGTPAYRSLCADFGADVTMGEMIFARHLLKGDRREAARLRRHEREATFGAQIATNNIAEGLGAIRRAKEAGVCFVDLNCGCPIREATRRGLGSALLRKPEKLARLVGGLVADAEIPVSVKLRLGPENTTNVDSVLEAFAALPKPPAFVTIHGRTATMRYRTPADYDAIERGRKIFPNIVGNGDVLTPYEALRKPIPTLMIGRGALICPWIFQDIKANTTWLPTAEERVLVYYDLARRFQSHFGTDQKGKQMAWYFFPWHFDFLTRWRPLTSELFSDFGSKKPLIQSSREIDAILANIEGPRDQLPPLERLLRCSATDAHLHIAAALWDADSPKTAVRHLTNLATPENLERWDNDDLRGDRCSRDEDEGHQTTTKKKPVRELGRMQKRKSLFLQPPPEIANASSLQSACIADLSS